MRSEKVHKISHFINKTNRKYGMWFREIPESLAIIAVALLLFFLFFSNRYADNDPLVDLDALRDLSAGWTVTKEDGTTFTADLPIYVPAEYEEEVAVTSVLPDDITSRDYLCMRVSHQNVSIYVDGELIEEIVKKEEKVYRSTVPSHLVFIGLEERFAGKEIRIVGDSGTDTRKFFSGITCGEKAELITSVLRDDIWNFGFSVLFLIIGVTAVIIGMTIRILSRNEFQLDHIGWALFLVALWDMSQSEFRDILFVNYKAASVAAPVALVMFAITLSLYFNSLTHKRYSVELGTYDFICFVYLAYICVLQVRRKSDITDHLPVTMVLLYIFFIITFLMMWKDKNRGLISDYLPVAIGYVIVSVSGLLQIAEYAINRSNTNGIFLASGAAILMVLAFVHSGGIFLKLNSERAAALKLAEDQSDFLARMSHEIRTPINAMLGMNEAILKESEDEETLSYARDVEQSGHLLLSLVNDILDFSKLESGKMDLAISEYDIKPMLQSCYQMIKTRADEKNLDVVFEIDENLPARYVGDEVRLQQVLMNFLTNAVKYTEHGKVGLQVSGKGEGNKYILEFVISDTGIGIKEDDLKRLFTAFQRLDEVKNKHVEGTGLGLAIASQLIKMMDGRVNVESTYGSGTIFTLSIPMFPVGAEKVGVFSLEIHEDAEDKPVKKDLFKAPDAKVLIVDDIKVNLKVAEKLLKNTEVKLTTAQSGDECLDLVTKETFDVILLDHMMPKKDGIETFREMKRLKDNPNKKTPVVMLTANAVIGAREEYMDEGFSDYISKPFSSEEIETVLMHCIPEEKITLI